MARPSPPTGNQTRKLPSLPAGLRLCSRSSNIAPSRPPSRRSGQPRVPRKETPYPLGKPLPHAQQRAARAMAATYHRNHLVAAMATVQVAVRIPAAVMVTAAAMVAAR